MSVRCPGGEEEQRLLAEALGPGGLDLGSLIPADLRPRILNLQPQGKEEELPEVLAVGPMALAAPSGTRRLELEISAPPGTSAEDLARAFRPTLWSTRQQRDILPARYTFSTARGSVMATDPRESAWDEPSGRVCCTLDLPHGLVSEEEEDLLEVSLGRLHPGSAVELEAMSCYSVAVPVLASVAAAAEACRDPEAADLAAALMRARIHAALAAAAGARPDGPVPLPGDLEDEQGLARQLAARSGDVPHLAAWARGGARALRPGLPRRLAAAAWSSVFGPAGAKLLSRHRLRHPLAVMVMVSIITLASHVHRVPEPPFSLPAAGVFLAASIALAGSSAPRARAQVLLVLVYRLWLIWFNGQGGYVRWLCSGALVTWKNIIYISICTALASLGMRLPGAANVLVQLAELGGLISAYRQEPGCKVGGPFLPPSHGTHAAHN